jgi:hypothetical protein
MGQILVMKYENEINQIGSDSIATFTMNVLEKANDAVAELDSPDNTCAVVSVVDKLLSMFNTTDHGRDVFLSAAILHDIYQYCQDSQGEWVYNELHPLIVRERSKEFKDALDQEEYDGIMDLVEGHHGMASVNPKFIPRHDFENGMIGIEWALAMAVVIATEDNE